MILSLFWRKPDFLQADDVIIAELACDVEKLIVLFKGFLMQKGFGENPAVACE